MSAAFEFKLSDSFGLTITPEGNGGKNGQRTLCSTQSSTSTCTWDDKACHTIWASSRKIQVFGYMRRRCHYHTASKSNSSSCPTLTNTHLSYPNSSGRPGIHSRWQGRWCLYRWYRGFRLHYSKHQPDHWLRRSLWCHRIRRSNSIQRPIATSPSINLHGEWIVNVRTCLG